MSEKVLASGARRRSRCRASWWSAGSCSSRSGKGVGACPGDSCTWARLVWAHAANGELVKACICHEWRTEDVRRTSIVQKQCNIFETYALSSWKYLQKGHMRVGIWKMKPRKKILNITLHIRQWRVDITMHIQEGVNGGNPALHCFFSFREVSIGQYTNMSTSPLIFSSCIISDDKYLKKIFDHFYCIFGFILSFNSIWTLEKNVTFYDLGTSWMLNQTVDPKYFGWLM